MDVSKRRAVLSSLLSGLLLASISAAADPPPGPLMLEQAIELALERNPELQAAAERIGEAEARVKEATAAFYPELKARISDLHSNNPALAFSMIVAQRRFSFEGFDINNPGFEEDFRPEIAGTWSLYRGGQDAARRKAAELGLEVSTLERSALRNRLAAAVTSAYYVLRASPEQVEVARRSIEAVQSELRHAQARFSEGTGLRSDVLSLEVRLAQAREAELRAHNAVELARSGLKTLLGLSTESPLEINTLHEPPLPQVKDNFSKLLEEALGNRPEMQAASRQVELRRRELEAEKATRLPRLNAFASYGSDNPDPGFSLKRDNVTVGVTAELDLFTGHRNQARIAAAERKLAEAQALRERTRLTIEEEVKKAFLTLKEAIARVRVTETAVGAAEEALRLVGSQYRGGTATVTRYLEAEAARAEARSHAIAARYEAQSAWAGVKMATGFWK